MLPLVRHLRTPIILTMFFGMHAVEDTVHTSIQLPLLPLQSGIRCAALRCLQLRHADELEPWDLERTNQKDLVTAAEMIRLAEKESLFSTVP